MILTINAVENGEYLGHCGGGHKVSGNGCTTLLPCNPFLHQSDISLLLFNGAALGTQRGFEDVMQLDLICNSILCVKHAEAMHFCRHAGVV